MQNFQTIDQLFNKKSIIYFLMILMIIIVYIRGFNELADWDSTNYIANGLSIIHDGHPLINYPGTLFSVTIVYLTELIFNNNKFSSFAYLGIIPLIITIIFSYRICRLYTSRLFSLCVLATIFMFFDFYCGVSHMLVQVQSDGALLMFLSIAAYASLKEKYLLSAFCISFAFFFRSQAIMLAIFIPLLFKNKKYSMVFSYFVIFLLTLVVFDFVIKYLFHIKHSGEFSFYTFFFTAFSNYLGLTYEQILDKTYYFIYHFKKSYVYAICSLGLAYFYMRKFKDYSMKKLFYYGLFLYICTFLFVIHMIFSGIGASDGENRYFIYSTLFCAIAAFVSVAKWSHTNKYIRNGFLIFIAVLFIGRSAFAIYSLKNIDKRFYANDFDSSNIPSLPAFSNIAVVGFYAEGILYNVFRNQYAARYYSSSCEKIVSEKNNISYIFIVDIKLCPDLKANNHLIGKEAEFEKIWESKEPYRPFTLLKKK